MDFHGRMVNIPYDDDAMLDLSGDSSRQLYKLGHRDARHAAAEIANEADRTICELQAQIGRLVGELEVANGGLAETLEMLEKVADERDKLATQIKQLMRENATSGGAGRSS